MGSVKHEHWFRFLTAYALEVRTTGIIVHEAPT